MKAYKPMLISQLLDNWHRMSKIDFGKRSKMKTYAFDFVLSDGDTVKEKSERLYEIVSIFCVRAGGEKMEVRAGKEIGRLLIVAADMNKEADFTPKYEEQGNGVIFVGQVKKDCQNGYCADFDLYMDLHQTKDEILVGDGTTVKVFNYPFAEENDGAVCGVDYDRVGLK